MNREWLIIQLNSLMWAGRRYGHDDYGLYGFGVDINGNPVDDDDDADVYHPEAVALADELLEKLS